MKGKNLFRLNEASVIEALQTWANGQFKSAVKVLGVYRVPDSEVQVDYPTEFEILIEAVDTSEELDFSK